MSNPMAQSTERRSIPSGLPGFVSWLVFPILLSLVAVVSLQLIATALPRPVVSSSVLAGLVVVISILERLAPLHPSWNARPDRLDILLIVVNRIVDIGIVTLTLGVLAWIDARSAGSGRHTPWPTDWPLPAQAVLGIGIAELIRYAFHRVSHRPGLLGRVHRIHHEPLRMYALNGPRLHPGNQLWISFSNVVPMLALGASLDAVVLVANLTVAFVLFQHANVALRFDGLNRVLATPDVHRLHHLRERQLGKGVNYGIVLLVYDLLFGTAARASAPVAADAIGPGDR